MELGFALTVRCLWSQLCSLYKGPLDETINQGPPCEYACKKIVYTHIKDPVVHVRVWWDYGNNKRTQHALKVSSLHQVEVGHYTKEEEDSTRH